MRKSPRGEINGKMLNVMAIIVSKMTSYRAGTVQMRGVRKQDNKVRNDVI